MERPRRDKENRKQPKLKDLKKKKKRLRSQLNDLEKSISLKKDLMNEEMSSVVSYVTKNMNHDAFFNKHLKRSNPYRGKLPSFSNPFASRVKSAVQYSGMSRQELLQEGKDAKELEKSLSLPARPILITGAKGSGKHTLFAQLQRRDMKKEISETAMRQALPVIRLTCLADMKTMLRVALVSDKLECARKAINDANGWYKGATKDLAALWEDDNVKEVFWRRHEASFVLPFSVSSSTSEFLDRIEQFEADDCVITIPDYLQAPRSHYINLVQGSPHERVIATALPEEDARVDITKAIPSEILQHVMSFIIDPSHLASFECANRVVWRAVNSVDQVVWRTMCLKYSFPTSPANAKLTNSGKSPVSYREIFREWYSSLTGRGSRGIKEHSSKFVVHHRPKPFARRFVVLGDLLGNKSRYIDHFGDESGYACLFFLLDATLTGEAYNQALLDWANICGTYRGSRVVLLTKVDLLLRKLRREHKNPEAAYNARLSAIEGDLDAYSKPSLSQRYMMCVNPANLLDSESVEHTIKEAESLVTHARLQAKLDAAIGAEGP